MLTRRQIRVKVMQALYAQQAASNAPADVFQHLLDEDFRALRSEHHRSEEPGEDDALFLKNLYFGVIKHRTEYEQLILERLENWDLSRVAIIDRLLLLMGTYELLECPTVPVKVTINEYLDIAKEYSTDKSSQFVNGILDNLHQRLKSQQRIVKTGRGLIDPGASRPAAGSAGAATPNASGATQS